MRYIAVGVDTELLAEEVAASSTSQLSIALVVDTTPAAGGGPEAIARVLGVHASTIVDALNASVTP